MKTLDIEIQSGGFTYRRIARRGNWAVYVQLKGEHVVSYELIRIQVRQAETIRGREYPERETYPPNESWGSEAFTIVDKEEAMQRMIQLAEIDARKVPGNELEAVRG